MKRLFIICLTICAISQLCNAQTPINDPLVFVTENGSSTGDGIGNGTWFNAPISADCFMSNICNSMYSGDVKVYFEGGDYYTDFDFTNIPYTIQSIQMYGGFNQRSRRHNLSDRDFENYETRFHAVTNHLIWFEAIGYHHPNSWNTCIIDGITLTSDYHYVNFSAIRIIGGDHIISQCKFEGFYSSTYLIWLETAGNTVTFTNCLFDLNKAYNLMALCTHINLINITIADNIFTGDMFRPFSSYYNNVFYTYNLYNSIIYNNSNMDMEYHTYANHYGLFNVSNSILHSLKNWVIDLGYNQYNVNPVFTNNPIAPYSCNYYTSPAVAAGNASLITLCSHYSFKPEIMDYDVANMDRYWDAPPTTTTVDIGAYQNGYDDGTYLYSVGGPIMRQESKNSTETSESKSVAIWSDFYNVYVDNIQETDATLFIYNATGQVVYTAVLSSGFNCIPLAVNTGLYIAAINSNGEKETVAKPIIIQ